MASFSYRLSSRLRKAKHNGVERLLDLALGVRERFALHGLAVKFAVSVDQRGVVGR